MTITPTTDTDSRVIYFLNPMDQVSLSGVNKKYYQLLTPDHFKKLFETLHPHMMKMGWTFVYSNHPELKQKHVVAYPGLVNLKGLRAIYRYFGDYINPWKLACGVFQTGCLKFSNSYFHLNLGKRIENCEAKIQELKDRRTMICGDRYEDPRSSIHQAWVAHKETEHLLECDFEEQRQDLSTTFSFDLESQLQIVYLKPTKLTENDVEDFFSRGQILANAIEKPCSIPRTVRDNKDPCSPRDTLIKLRELLTKEPTDLIYYTDEEQANIKSNITELQKIITEKLAKIKEL